MGRRAPSFVEIAKLAENNGYGLSDPASENYCRWWGVWYGSRTKSCMLCRQNSEGLHDPNEPSVVPAEENGPYLFYGIWDNETKSLWPSGEKRGRA